jgi:hypothetical protein
VGQFDQVSGTPSNLLRESSRTKWHKHGAQKRCNVRRELCSTQTKQRGFGHLSVLRKCLFELLQFTPQFFDALLCKPHASEVSDLLPLRERERERGKRQGMRDGQGRHSACTLSFWHRDRS